MKLTHYPPEKLAGQLKKIVFDRLDRKKYKLFFFGSRVAGTSFERSDVDIGIEGSSPVPKTTMVEIEEEVADLPILYKMDVVDFKTVGNRFYKIASKHKEYIH
jgi:predicted nucleotidyltransferase